MAKKLLLNCPTFRFDEIGNSIVITKVVRSQSASDLGIDFTRAHSGFGDRSGQDLLEVITPHQILITIEDGKVSSAIIDDVWGEVDQRLLPRRGVTTDKTVYHEGDSMTITIRNTSILTVRFGSTAYGLSFEKLEGDKWAFNSSVIGAEVIVKLEPEQTKRITVRLSNFDRPFTCGNCRVLSSGWTE